MEHYGFFLTSILLMGASIMVVTWYRMRKERLAEREKMVEEKINVGIFERPWNDSKSPFIFKSVWTLGDIVNIAKKHNYVLNINDCYRIIGYIRTNHDKSVGINNKVILDAIEYYIYTRLHERAQTYQSNLKAAVL